MSDFLVINGYQCPTPVHGFQIVHSQTVDAGRNSNGAVVGQLVGRKLWKINNLEWKGLSATEWANLKAALEPFYVPVTFTGDDNVRRTIYMYPGDTIGQPLSLDGIFYNVFETCSFNLVDCGR